MEKSSSEYTHEFVDLWLKIYEAYKDYFNMWIETYSETFNPEYTHRLNANQV